MKAINVGDVFRISTHNGGRCLQFVHDNKTIGQLLRVLPGRCTNDRQRLRKVVESRELYLIHFPLRAAVNQGLVEFIGNYPLPEGFELPQRMRDDVRNADGSLRNWQIVNYKTWTRSAKTTLTNDELALSPWGIWNHALLAQRLDEDWTPEKWT